VQLISRWFPLLGATFTLAAFTGGAVKLASWCKLILFAWADFLVILTSKIFYFLPEQNGATACLLWMIIFMIPIVLFSSTAKEVNHYVNWKIKLRFAISVVLLVFALDEALRQQMNILNQSNGVLGSIPFGSTIFITVIQLYIGWSLGNFLCKCLKRRLSLYELSNKVYLFYYCIFQYFFLGILAFGWRRIQL